MSSLLEQAIVDAKALKEAALKNAENLVVEKYAREVKNTMHTLLEQEEVAVGVESGGKEDKELNSIVEQIPDAFLTEDEEKIIIDLDELAAHINEALRLDEAGAPNSQTKDGKRVLHDVFPTGSPQIDLEEDSLEEVELDEDVFEEDEGEDGGLGPGGDPQDEGISLEEFQNIISEMSEEPLPDPEDAVTSASEEPLVNPEEMSADPQNPTVPEEEANASLPDRGLEDLAQALMSYQEASSGEDIGDYGDLSLEEEIYEAVTKVEAEPQLTGWSDAPQSELSHLEDMALAMLKDDEVAELVKEMEKLQKENKTLKTKAKVVVTENKKLHKAVGLLRNKVEEVNVSNAKLLYINQTLESISLNERQKENIVEAISKAGSVKEAKIIYETLKHSVSGLKQERPPGTLTEAVSSKSSLLIAARQNGKKDEYKSPFFDRMQKLAGLKK